MMGTIVVFGGSGFIGTHLIRRITAEGRSRVLSVDLLPPHERLDGVDYLIGDVRDLGALTVLLPVERIYNLAAVHTTPGHPTHEYYETNIAGALEVTRFAERNSVSEIVFTSSISVYGPSETTKNESTTPTPNSSYGYSKLLAEKAHRHWLDRGIERKLTIVRPAVVFGPGEGGNFTRLAALLRRGVFLYPGRKDTIKACIFVEDLLDAIEFARISPERVVVFNGAYPDRYTLEQIVETLKETDFPNARSALIPGALLRWIAATLNTFKFTKFGIHPERVTKLMRSTDIVPSWLVENGFEFPTSLQQVMRRWSKSTDGTFR